MPGERRLRILTTLVGDGGTGVTSKHLCEVCAEITRVSGAAIMLLSSDVSQGSVCSTNDLSAVLEQLQVDLGEGPCVDAYHGHHPVIESNLEAPQIPRWPAFASAAVEAGAGSMFAFPLQIGAVRLGALQLHGDRPSVLTDEQHADALVMADVAAEAVLVMQTDAAPGELAAALADGGDFQNVVHQASGMVAAQLGTTVGQALLRLRAYAFGNDRTVANVSGAVVARSLRFGDEGTLGGKTDG